MFDGLGSRSMLIIVPRRTVNLEVTSNSLVGTGTGLLESFALVARLESFGLWLRSLSGCATGGPDEMGFCEAGSEFEGINGSCFISTGFRIPFWLSWTAITVATADATVARATIQFLNSFLSPATTRSNYTEKLMLEMKSMRCSRLAKDSDTGKPHNHEEVRQKIGHDSR